MTEIFAHIGGPDDVPHELIDHLREVARRARAFAATADPTLAALAEVTGWLHDLGKFRDEFQQHLRGSWRGPEKQKRHAVFGAAAACVMNMPSVAFAVLGHHAGLHDCEGWQESLADPALTPTTTGPELLRRLETMIPDSPFPWREPIADRLIEPDRNGYVSSRLDRELRARILFSCLVDADYLDTERYFTGVERSPIPLDPATLLARLHGHVRTLSGPVSDADGPVIAARRDVFAACERAAAHPPGLFSLTAPTGSGKTLAAMAFALEHARRHGLRRVIVVLPFLAIIEQNARVYRDALNVAGGEDVVLEHHSAVTRDSTGDDGESANESTLRAKQATENWDAPVIVTTAVQFLESLFSRRPGRCRKLHNIARSVVLFDEVQTLPFPLLDPILSVLRDLSTTYGVSSLLCSATRPTFAKSENLPNGFMPGECREVLGERQKTFHALRRARLEVIEGAWSWEQLADRLEQEPKALVIVNLRKHAQTLYDVLKRRGFPSLFHLSSTMCPAHREQVLGRKADPADGTIYAALKTNRCVLISTQVVEAGVDIDFPVVYRAISPLDSIIQAAGRCDREGRLTKVAGAPAGRVVVFRPDEKYIAPPGYYDRATTRTTRFLSEHAADPSRLLNDPDVFEAFHHLLVLEGEGRDLSRTIQQKRRMLNFKEVDALFKLIDDAGRGVIVPYGEGKSLIEAAQAANQVKSARRYEYLRRLQRFTVGLMPNWIEHFRARGLLQPLFIGQEDGPLHYTGGDYDSDALGLRLGELPVETFVA